MVATNYVWNPVFDCITKEINDAGATVARYTQEPKLYGGIISQHRSGATSIYHFDAIGTTRALTNSSQNATDTTAYTAFGIKSASVGTTTNPFGFVGKVGCFTSTNSVGYIDIRWRNFCSRHAVWTSVDPIAIQSGRTDQYYMYCLNSPGRFTDPSGLLTPQCFGCLVGGAAGVMLSILDDWEDNDLDQCKSTVRAAWNGLWGCIAGILAASIPGSSQAISDLLSRYGGQWGLRLAHFLWSKGKAIRWTAGGALVGGTLVSAEALDDLIAELACEGGFNPGTQHQACVSDCAARFNWILDRRLYLFCVEECNVAHSRENLACRANCNSRFNWILDHSLWQGCMELCDRRSPSR